MAEKNAITCPSWMPKEAKKEWRRVVKLLQSEGKEFTQKDVKAMEAYCTNYAKWKQCETVLAETGMTMSVGENGYIQQRPEVSIANKAQQEMRAWAKELGLTPASRQRMKQPVSAEGLDLELEGMIAHD